MVRLACASHTTMSASAPTATAPLRGWMLKICAVLVEVMRDEFVRREPAGAHAVVPQHAHAVLDPAGAVGDPGEIVAPGRLLRRAEAAMIGGRGLQRAARPALPTAPPDGASRGTAGS